MGAAKIHGFTVLMSLAFSCLTCLQKSTLFADIERQYQEGCGNAVAFKRPRLSSCYAEDITLKNQDRM
ncbi:MAG TPA: hypothetical protein DEF79_05820 [Gammaproteobacteria bacterium]|nr:hypothetical protein [Gammaproteobacteria bacterium]